ncbi:copper-translocating P-type ATPase [Candidatus Dojkabacteria bacterium]|nr:copper-translocating P-type ATPase [Candidatus Dojkabacteria bacterium]
MSISKVLNKTDGVKNCEVNIGNEKAVIEYDPEKTNLQELNNKIEPLGYSLDTSAVDPHKNMDHSQHSGIGQNKKEKLKELERQKNKLSFILPITILTFILMMWEIAAISFSWVPKFMIPMELFQPILLILSSLALFWIGNEFLKEVIIFAKYKVANMYTLIGIGTLVAYIYSTIIVLLPQVRIFLGLPEAVYFDVTIVVIGFVYLGKYLETKSKLSTGEAIEKLLNLQAKTALIERDGKEIEVSIEAVKINDIIIVKPAGRIPVDGKIIEGKSSVDESMITGEAIPVDKITDDLVIGGTINKQGAFKFKATKVGTDTVLSQIIKMVDEAQGSKAPIQGLADKISAVFVPGVLILSLATLLSWLLIAPYFIPFSDAISYGLLCFTGVLIIACPCALGLATPTAIIVGTGKGAENGILIKDAASLEKLNKVKVIVTDKTGTITKGKPEVTDIVSTAEMKEKEILQLLASLENKSEHPLAIAILQKAKKDNLELLKVEDFEIIEGKGLFGKIHGEKYYAGNLKLAADLKIDINNKVVDEFAKSGKTPVLFMSEKILLGIIGISDTVKENSKSTIETLHKMGIKVIMLTGDNKSTAQFIAKQVGIDEVIAEVLPQDKAKMIKELQSSGEIVAMVGDGINDAPALAQADIGIAMSTGTDVAIESASITLLKGDFSKVLQAIKLSKFTIKAIKQNLFWAFAYNIIGIPLAAGLFYPLFGILLNPVFAGLAMAFSSVSVVSNSLRLKFSKLD